MTLRDLAVVLIRFDIGLTRAGVTGIQILDSWKDCLMERRTGHVEQQRREVNKNPRLVDLE
mgnify:CR=1 FL=1